MSLEHLGHQVLKSDLKKSTQPPGEKSVTVTVTQVFPDGKVQTQTLTGVAAVALVKQATPEPAVNILTMAMGDGNSLIDILEGAKDCFLALAEQMLKARQTLGKKDQPPG